MKEFLEFNDVRDDGLLLADRIYKAGFIPDIVYIVSRGGFPMGNIMTEYFKLKQGFEPKIAVISAHSYTKKAEVQGETQVIIDGWTINPFSLDKNAKLLIVDDLYHSGNSMRYIVRILLQHFDRENIKIAVHDFHKPDEEQDIVPDYFCRMITDWHWINYMSHELIGLTKEEIQAHYPIEVQAVLLENMPRSGQLGVR